MDNARDEPLIVQLWLELHERPGWDRVRVVFVSSAVTVSDGVDVWEAGRPIKDFQKNFFFFSHKVLYFLFYPLVLFFISLTNGIN